MTLEKLETQVRRLLVMRGIEFASIEEIVAATSDILTDESKSRVEDALKKFRAALAGVNNHLADELYQEALATLESDPV